MKHSIIGWWRLSALFGLLFLGLSCAKEAAAGGPRASVQTLEIIDEMLEAHGGLEAWRSAPTVSYECSFRPAGAADPILSREVIQQGLRRAYIDYPGTEMRLAWNGEKAWSENWSGAYPPRFIALLNYYFLNLPWLTQDPGVVLANPGTARLWDDPKEYTTIKMTFESGVGDTPDDYYVLYIDPATHQLKACRYIVTFAAILPEGVEASPEKIFVYEEFDEVNGLSVPTRCAIRELDGSPYASIEIADWSFSNPFDKSRMEMSKAAVLDTSEM